MRSCVSRISTGLLIALPLLVILKAGAVCASLTEAEIANHLEEGERHFRKGIELDRSDPDLARDFYLKAILHFERIVDDGGINNGKLFYNIGNAYFRLEDIGRAVLNYKRAMLYIPNDENLRKNLDFARSRRADRIERKERAKVLETIFFLHYDLSARVRFTAFIIFFISAWVSGAVYLFVKAGSVRIVMIVVSVLCFVFLVSLVAEGVSKSRRPEGVVLEEETIARKGDAETYERSFTEPLHSGTEFRMLEKRPGWIHIELNDGARCWIPENSAELVSS